MPRSRTLKALQLVVIVWSGFIALPIRACWQRPTNPFEDYFSGPTAARDIGSDRNWPAYEKLANSIASMTPAEIAAGISVIDSQLDSTAESQSPFAKVQALYLLRYIAFRQDGPGLLASQMDRLTSLLNDPTHSLSGQALLVLQMIGYKTPEAVWPILEAALKDPEVNNKTGLGPGIAIILLFMGPHGDDVTEHVVEYMRRPDLTDSQLLDTIMGINNSPVIPDMLAAELVRCLDRPNEHVKSRALVGIARSSPSAKDAARARVQRMTNDPRETPHIRRLAAEALEGQITEDPDTGK